MAKKKSAPAKSAPSKGASARKTQAPAHSGPVASPQTWALVAMALSALSPFVFVSESQYLVDTSRFVGLLFAAAACVWAWARPAQLEPADGIGRWIDYSILGLAVVVLVSSLTSASPAQALTWGAERSYMGAPSWLALLVVFLTAARVRLGRRVQSALRFALIPSPIFAMWAIVQVLRGQAVSGGFMNTDWFGPVMLMSIPLALIEVRAARGSAVKQSLWAALTLVNFIAAVAGRSSSAAQATAVVLVCAVVLLVPDLVGLRAGLPRKVAGITAAVVLAIGTLLVAMVLVVPGSVPGSIGARLDSALHSTNARSRVFMWGTAVAVFRDSPIVGVGPDGFQLASQSHIPDGLIAAGGSEGVGFGALIRDPHSVPMLLLAEFGLVGMLGFGLLAVVWTRALLRRRAGDPRSASVRTAYALSFGAFALPGLFVPWSVVFAALPALVGGLAVAPSQPTGEGDKAAGALRKALSHVWRSPWVAASVAGAVTLLALWLGVAAISGESLLRQLDTYPTADKAVAILDQAITWQPTRPYLRYQLLRQEGLAAENDNAAMATYRKHVDGARREVLASGGYMAQLAQPALDHAQETSDTASLAWAENLLGRAALLSPNHPDVVLESLHAALLAGDIVLAEQLSQRVSELKIRRPRENVYREMLLRAQGRNAEADAMAARIRSVFPDLAYLLR
jgi:hypothetical protein